MAGPDEEKLIDYLFNNSRYNLLSRPVSDESDAVNVVFGLSLQQIINVVRR
jgi:Neurotransmitter-gated ion-channel ligand binding domain